MKKYLIRTIPVILIALILPMSGGFCFQDLFGQAAQAAAPARPDNNQLTDPIGNCSDNQTDNNAASQIPAAPAAPAPVSSHNNSPLSCCLGNGQPSAIFNFSSSSDLEKSALAVFVAPLAAAPREDFKTIIYHAPGISPPDLLALKTTILRL